jgi:hypothetical protein
VAGIVGVSMSLYVWLRSRAIVRIEEETDKEAEPLAA